MQVVLEREPSVAAVRRRLTTVFFHAHPDDEAIFTGGTIAELTKAGHRVVVLVATSGELGRLPGPDADRGWLGAVRRAETRRAAALLGVDRVRFLDYKDSGLPGAPSNDAPGALWSSDVGGVAARTAKVLREERADALVVYDEFGVYGHPDHIAVHRAGIAAAALAGIDTVYEATVDRDYLRLIGSHIVEQAALAAAGAGGAARLGVPTALVTTVVDVRGALAAKRSAMAAHASQIALSTALGSEWRRFADVYGFEWYVRRGPVGPIEQLMEPASGSARPQAPTSGSEPPPVYPGGGSCGRSSWSLPWQAPS